MRNSRLISRVVALAVIVAGVAAVAVVLARGSGTSYVVHADFINASQLVKGNLVQVAGKRIGKVSDITLTDNGQADVEMRLSDGGYSPLKLGTRAVVRQASLSGVANRYVDLTLPGGDPPDIPDGGRLSSQQTTSAVDLDQLFDTFDPKTRNALAGVIRGSADSYRGQGQAANRGWTYLNPALASSSRLFAELNRDTPMLTRFIVSSSKLVTDVAERRGDLSGLVDHLATTTGAIARRQNELADSIDQLPRFMRRANTTFVNLRATLDDLEPLIDESKPVAKKLRPFLAELRPLARDARPTLADLAVLVRKAGADNDLIDLTRSNAAVRDIAVRDVQRNGKTREGALPATTRALGTATPELAYARPYAVDLTGWFDDFSHSGLYDALGGASRAAPNVNAFALVNGVLKPVLPGDRAQAFKDAATLNQRNRCPGSAERTEPNGRAYKPSPDYPCDDTQVPPGP